MALVSVICSMFVCVVPLSLPSSRDLVYPLLGFEHENSTRAFANPAVIATLYNCIKAMAELLYVSSTYLCYLPDVFPQDISFSTFLNCLYLLLAFFF